jgi:hypothetical protein
MILTPDTAIAIVAAGLGYTCIVSSLEFAWNYRLTAPGSILDWEILRTRTVFSMRVPCMCIAKVHPAFTWLALCGIRTLLGLAALPLPGTTHQSMGIALILIGISTLAIMYRLMYGLDGADQLLAILSLTCGAALVVDSLHAIEAFCWFTTLLVTIAYVTAGVTKAISPTWRKGEALALIMRTETYGSAKLIDLADHHVGRLLCRVVIVLELAFPLIFVGHPVTTVAILGILGAFHCGTAVVMGLNCFLPAYVCTYGCVAWCSFRLHEVLYSA